MVWWEAPRTQAMNMALAAAVAEPMHKAAMRAGRERLTACSWR